MTEKEIFDKVVGIITPHAKNTETLARVDNNTSILKDLGVNSSRLVDIIIAMEDQFGVEVSDEDAEKVSTVGDAVVLLKAKV